MWEYLVDLFNRAAKNKALTAHERAALKALQGAIVGIIIDAAPQLLQVATGQAHFNFSGMAVSALLGAIILGALKIWLSQNDPQVGMLLDAYAKQKEQTALSQIFVAGPDGSTQIPAMHFILPAPGVIVTTSTVPVTKPDPAGIQAVVPVTLNDPHATPTDPHPAIDSSLLNTQQVPAVTASPPPVSFPATPISDITPKAPAGPVTQFAPLAFTQPPPVPTLSNSPLPPGIPLPPQQ